MQIVDTSSAWISNYEVLEHLKEQKEVRDKVSMSLGRPVKAAENVQTIEFETLSYLEGCERLSKLDSKKFEKTMEFLKEFSLTKAEKLQIVNILPSSEVEFYLIVEECEERLTADQIDQIIHFIRVS